MYEVGTVIKNVCHNCNNSQMTIYRTDNIGVWCKCEKCGAVDDLSDEELGNGEDIVYPEQKEGLISVGYEEGDTPYTVNKP